MRPMLLFVFAAFSLPVFAGAQDAKVITAVQAELGVPADGKMGPKTQAALKEFQRAKGLEPTGQLDKPTLTALGLSGPKPAPPSASQDGEGKSSTPVGPAQSSAERTAEPRLQSSPPTGEKN